MSALRRLAYVAAVERKQARGVTASFSPIRSQVSICGVSAIWVLANFCYAGMRAQDHPSANLRGVAFLCGLPGTLITFFLVDEYFIGYQQACGARFTGGGTDYREPDPREILLGVVDRNIVVRYAYR